MFMEPNRPSSDQPQPQQNGYQWPPTAPAAPVQKNDSANWQRPVEPAPTQGAPHNYWQTPQPQSASAHPKDAPTAHGLRHLNMSKGEVLLREIRRHPIGVLQIYFVAAIVLLALLVGGGALVRYIQTAPPEGIITDQAFPFPVETITWLAFGLGLMAVVISAIAIHVYNGNRLYLTNESVIQRVQSSLFHTKEQQIPLSNIEDVSYEQNGLFPHIFHYGTIRLSTEGEETTYYFRFAASPKEQVFHIVNAQEEFIRKHPETSH